MHNYLELIKERVKVVEYIGRYVNLKHKSGGEYVGRCPFHEEKTASFTVSTNKSFFHCFGCSAHGDVVAFAAQHHRLSYKEAMQKLADEYGIANKSKTEDWKERKYAEIYKALSEHYHKALLSDQGKIARTYLEKRGMTESIWWQYKLGWAGTESKKWMLQNFEQKDLIFSKALIQKSDYIFNPFQNRLIFPIKWRDNIIAFGGRSLNDELKPKYLNSSDSILFQKGKILYGLYSDFVPSAKNISNSTEDNNPESITKFNDSKLVVVVEGYMDVLAMANEGFKNVVAPLGTGMTIDQINLLWQKFQKIIFCFDNDLAGQNAMYRVANLVWKHLTPDKSIRFVQLVDGKDPDEVITSKGASHLVDALTNSQHIVDFLFDKMTAEYDLSTMEARASFRDRLRKMAIQHKDLNFEYQRELGKKLWSLTSAKTDREKEYKHSKWPNEDSNNNKIDWQNGDKHGESCYKQISTYGRKYTTSRGEYNPNTAIAAIPSVKKTPYSHHLVAMLKALMIRVPSEKLEEIASLDIDNEDLAIVRDIIINEAITNTQQMEPKLEQEEQEDGDGQMDTMAIDLFLDKIPAHCHTDKQIEQVKKAVNYVKDFSLPELKADNVAGIIDRCVLLHNLFSLQHQIKQVSKRLLLCPDAELETKLLTLKKHELQLQMSISTL